MHLPLVSVVMSVRNGGEQLFDTITSILNQTGIDLEFIIVDDGSTDQTRAFLSEIALQDSRIKLIARGPRGLTASLIEACEYASGELIARQDAYDYSVPDRLRIQAKSLTAKPSASMCSSHVKFITQERVDILIDLSSEEETNSGLSGIIHGSVMFRRKDYVRVGGYRAEFYYAQDVDLWTRLVEVGDHIVVPQVLYENCIHPNSISGSRKREQTKFHRFIVKAREARRSGKAESRWLAKASRFSTECKTASYNNKNDGNGAYFIGSCLIKNYPLLAKKYLEISINTNPFHIRARLKILGLK